MTNSIKFVGGHTRFGTLKDYLEGLGSNLASPPDSRDCLQVVLVAAFVGSGCWLTNVFRSLDVRGDCSLRGEFPGGKFPSFVFWHVGKSIFEFELLGSNHGER